MSTNGCPEDHFLDPVTSTCIKCLHICHPNYKTYPECKKYCPDYKLPKSKSYQASTQIPSSQQHLSGSGTGLTGINIIIIVFFVLLVLVMSFMLRVICRRNRKDLNLLYSSTLVKRSSCISGWQNMSKYCCTSELSNTSKDPAMSHLTINITHTSPLSIKSQFIYPVCGDTKLTDSGRGSSDSQSDHIDELSSLRPDHDDTPAGAKGIAIPSDNTYIKKYTINDQPFCNLVECSSISIDATHENGPLFIDAGHSDQISLSIEVSNDQHTSPKVPLHTPQVPDFNLEISDSMHNGISEPLELNTYYPNGSTKNMKHNEHHRANHLSESVTDMDREVNDDAAESEDQDSLSLHLVSCDQPISHPASDPLLNDGDTNDVWDKVMELYELIEGKLAQFPWIVGCMISSDRLELIMDRLKTHLNPDGAFDKLCKEIPEQLQQYLEISTEGPSIELCCEKYGAGCPVFDLEENGTRGRMATITLIGHNENDNYAFTVGHVLERHQRDCEIDCNCQTKMISKVNGSYQACRDDITGKDIKCDLPSEIYDMAVFKLVKPVTQNNGRTVYLSEVNQEQSLQVELDKSPPQMRSIMKKECLIFGPESRTSRALVVPCKPAKNMALVKKIAGQAPVFQVSMLELQSADPVLPLHITQGQSGSLVTSLPDSGSNTVKAFAYIIGHVEDNPKRAQALPLWENMCKVCEGNSDLLDTVKRLEFDNYNPIDSGYISAPVSSMNSLSV